MTPDIKDLRESERYFVIQKLTGSFGAAEVSLVDLAEQGAQIEHAQPLRLATKGRLWFKRGELSVSLHAIVVWSKLSKTPNEQGKYLYRSGLRIDDGATEFAGAMGMLARHGVIRRDQESLERKRKRQQERQEALSGQPTMKVVATESDITPDQVLLIEHARERLRSNFDEAQKWYSRAYFALRGDGRGVASEMMKYPEDVLAVWEYLERSMPLPIIKRIFDQLTTRSR